MLHIYADRSETRTLVVITVYMDGYWFCAE
jgi:hypothetical protein